MDEGLRQTLYQDPLTHECVFVVRQKGYIVNAVHIKPDELEDFQKKWKSGKLTKYGWLKGKKKKDNKKSNDDRKKKQSQKLMKDNIKKTEAYSILSFSFLSNNFKKTMKALQLLLF